MANLYAVIKVLVDSKEEKPISEILVDDAFVVPGYIFVTEYQNKRYMLVHMSDFQKIFAGLEPHHAELLKTHWVGVPILEDREKIERVVCGIFEKAISMRSTWQPSY